MMKVTRTTCSMLANIRHNRNKKTVMIQGMCKNGKWGKPFEVEMLGHEKTAEDVVARFIANNNKEYRVAE